MRHLIKDENVHVTVVAPVPWFPFTHKFFGKYGQFARAPRYENRNSVDVYHPRYLVLPKIGMRVTPHSLYKAGLAQIKALLASGQKFDVIDAHYFFPDGVAAAQISSKLGIPFTVTARGSDVTEIGHMAPFDQWITQAAAQAGQVMTVSESLRQGLIDLGVDAAKIKTLRNGVDLTMFQPEDYSHARRKLCDDLNLSIPIGDGNRQPLFFTSVGWLIKRKRHDLAISIAARYENSHLFIIGEGEEEASLRAHAQALGVAERVHFLGRIAHDRLKNYLSAMDVLMLMSEREGWPNVLLEAMACGTPVLARSVGGVEEFVNVPQAGAAVDSDQVDDLHKGMEAVLANYPNRKDVRAYAEGFSWAETSKAQYVIFRRLAVQNTPSTPDKNKGAE